MRFLMHFTRCKRASPLNAGIGADGVSDRMRSLSPPLRMASKNGRKQKTPDMYREFGGDPGRT